MFLFGLGLAVAGFGAAVSSDPPPAVAEASPSTAAPGSEPVAAGTNAVPAGADGATGATGATNAAGSESITREFGVNLLPTIDRQYATFGLDQVSVLRDRRILGIALWQYVASFIYLFLAFFVAKALDHVTRRWLKRAAEKSEADANKLLVEIAGGPVKIIVWVLLLNIGMSVFDWPPQVLHWFTTIMKVVVAVSLTYAGLKIVDIAVGAWRQRKIALRADPTFDQQLLPVIRKALKSLVIVVAALVTLDNIGINITGLIASLSIGGLALGLAAQNSLENFLGSINLLADRPVRVGDFCKYGDSIGTVEEIGLRSTRVRGIDRTVTTIPNGQFSKMPLTNFGRRDRILLQATLGLRYETTPDQIRYVLARSREMLIAHPRISPDPARIRFAGFGESSLNLEIFAYVPTADFNEFLAVREDVYLRLMDIVAEAGTRFAFPSRTIYFARDGGLDGERSRAARGSVEAWREAGQFPFPDYAPEHLERMRGTLEYPAKESAVRMGR